MIIKIADTKRIIHNPAHIAGILKDYFKTIDAIDRDKEHFFCFQLNSRNKIQVADIITIGILNASLVHPREVYTRAVKHRSTQIIVAHNHPSGNPDPSDLDIEITKKLVEAGNILQIELVDHIVYTPKAFFSFKEHHLI